FVATGFSLTSVGIAFGTLVLVVEKGDVLASLAMFVLGLVSGALFPLAVLPGWLEAPAKLVPTQFAFAGLRSALLRGRGWGEDVVVLAAVAIVILPLAVALFERGLRIARRRGSLARF